VVFLRGVEASKKNFVVESGQKGDGPKGKTGRGKNGVSETCPVWLKGKKRRKLKETLKGKGVYILHARPRGVLQERGRQKRWAQRLYPQGG